MLSQGPCEERKCNAQPEYIERLAFDGWHHEKCKAKAPEMVCKKFRVSIYFYFHSRFHLSESKV